MRIDGGGMTERERLRKVTSMPFSGCCCFSCRVDEGCFVEVEVEAIARTSCWGLSMEKYIWLWRIRRRREWCGESGGW